jgi:ribose transport system permease protein
VDDRLKRRPARPLNNHVAEVLFRRLRQNALLVTFVILFVIFSLSSKYFATANSLFIILTQLTPLGVVVIGQTLVIITGGIDLSVGSVAALTSVIAASLMSHTGGSNFSPLVAAAIALVIATGIGWIQGWLIARQRLSSFVVTFGSLSLIKGLALVSSNAAPMPISGTVAQAVWRAEPLPAPIPILVFVSIAAAVSYMLRNTKLGRYAFAIGSNETVTRMSGVRVDYYKIQIYMISSLLAGVAGLLLMTRISSGAYTIGEDYGLLSVAAAVVGGTSLQGGVGNIRGPLLGALIIVMIDTSLGLFNISPLWSTAIIGAFILVATLADRIQQRSQEEVPRTRVSTVQGEISYFAQMHMKMVSVVAQETACEHIRLYMVDRQTNDLIEHHLNTDDRTIIDQPDHLALHVAKTRGAHWINAWNDNNGLIVIPIHPQFDCRSVIAVPILTNQRLVGVLELQSQHEHVFSRDTADQLLKISEQLAQPLENAWLLDSGWLVRHTRDAFRHLGDEVYLSKCALAGWIYSLPTIPPSPIAMRGAQLNALLLKLIDMIQEKETQSKYGGKDRYQILHHTYVLGLSTDEVVAEMHVSRRQYFYDLKDAIEAVVHLLVNQDLPTLLEEV